MKASVPVPEAYQAVGAGLRAAIGGDRIDPRYYSSALITIVLISAQLTLGVLEGLDRLALSIGTCVLTELVLSRLLLDRWPNLASSYISGISVGILVRSLAYWPYFIGAVLAIMSKYVLRFQGRHLWNPSNFSIVLMLFTAPTAVNVLSRQWSNSPVAIAVIWSFGLLVVWRVSRLHVTAHISWRLGLLRRSEAGSRAYRYSRSSRRLQAPCTSFSSSSWSRIPRPGSLHGAAG
jgi:hypothetical protein